MRSTLLDERAGACTVSLAPPSDSNFGWWVQPRFLIGHRPWLALVIAQEDWGDAEQMETGRDKPSPAQTARYVAQQGDKTANKEVASL